MKRSTGRFERSQIQRAAPFHPEIRRFLQLSEQAAMEAAPQPQRHLHLLQTSGAPGGTLATISYIADVMGLRHNSFVERPGKSTPQTALDIPGR